MNTIKPHEYDPETWDDQETPETFQSLRKQTGKPATIKSERQKQAKEWGRSMHKYFKQQKRNGKP